MLTDVPRRDLIAYVVISLIGTVLLVLGISERVSSQPARPTQPLTGPVGVIPTTVPLRFPCPGLESLSYRTFGDIVDQIGPPEKVNVNRSVWGEQVPNIVSVEYLYPSKGIDFRPAGTFEKPGRDLVIDSYICYSPTTVAQRIIDRGDTLSFYQDWQGFDK